MDGPSLSAVEDPWYTSGGSVESGDLISVGAEGVHQSAGGTYRDTGRGGRPVVATASPYRRGKVIVAHGLLRALRCRHISSRLPPPPCAPVWELRACLLDPQIRSGEATPPRPVLTPNSIRGVRQRSRSGSVAVLVGDPRPRGRCDHGLRRQAEHGLGQRHGSRG